MKFFDDNFFINDFDTLLSFLARRRRFFSFSCLSASISFNSRAIWDKIFFRSQEISHSDQFSKSRMWNVLKISHSPKFWMCNFLKNFTFECEKKHWLARTVQSFSYSIKLYNALSLMFKEPLHVILDQKHLLNLGQTRDFGTSKFSKNIIFFAWILAFFGKKKYAHIPSQITPPPPPPPS